jgi:hypothetical protein
MDLPRSNDGEARFCVYVEGLTSVIGHADRLRCVVELDRDFMTSGMHVYSIANQLP